MKRSDIGTEEAVMGWLASALAAILGMRDDEIDLKRPFSYYGLGSAETVMIVGDLESWLGCTFPESLAFDYPDIASLSAHLAEHLDRYRKPEPRAANGLDT